MVYTFYDFVGTKMNMIQSEMIIIDNIFFSLF